MSDKLSQINVSLPHQNAPRQLVSFHKDLNNHKTPQPGGKISKPVGENKIHPHKDQHTGLDFNPDFWMSDDQFSMKVNCYLYALNVKSLRYSDAFIRGYDHEAYEDKPGGEAFFDDYKDIDPIHASATQIEKYKETLIKGAERDGLVYVGRNKTDLKDRNGYAIAFYIRRPQGCTENEALGFHFLRQDSRDPERWSGKWGGNKVTNEDKSGKIITNPETADMGAYRLVGYFIAPRSGPTIIRDRSEYMKRRNAAKTATRSHSLL
jgi:hypothetical protein